MRKNNLFSNIRWTVFVSRRFANVDRTGRSAVTTKLASLGICFGVMTLIVVLSVMNGFQMSFIDAIMEVSSYHLRVTDIPADRIPAFEKFCSTEKQIRTAQPFYEAQSLVAGTESRQAAALIRAVSPDIFLTDAGFTRELKMQRGSFDLSADNFIVIGESLAASLGVHTGSTVNLLALSGGSDTDLLSNDRIFTVTGIFHTGYADINSGYAFISLNAGRKYFGSKARLIYGLKFHTSSDDAAVMHTASKLFPGINMESWRSYNRSFFGALRIEKNMLMLLVFLIFLVVCINIFNGMRRLVYERRQEISILSALGGRNRLIQAIFVFRGFLMGIYGAVPGLALGLLISVRMEQVFTAASEILYNIQYFFVMLFSPSDADFVRENPMYLLYARIPARIFPQEVLLITAAGIFSALAASWLASRNILKMTVAEVLHDE